MTEDREKNAQTELNEQVKKHMEFMRNLGWVVKYVLCLGTAMVGFFALLHTGGDFGDVPMVLGIVGVVALFRKECVR